MAEIDHSPRRNFFILTNARITAGKYMAARIAMMARTHINSVSVKPLRFVAFKFMCATSIVPSFDQLPWFHGLHNSLYM